MADRELIVQAGEIVALRLFDVAYEIDLKRAEALWAVRAEGASVRSRLVATPAKAVSFGVPPLSLQLGQVEIEIGGVTLMASARARLYDFGIAALALRLPVNDMGWAEYSALVNKTNDAVGLASNTEFWARLLEQLRLLIGETWIRPTAAPLQEDYLIALVEQFDEPITSAALQERVDLVPLLSGQDRPLSEGARGDLLRHRFSYFLDDLAVITWDRAFLLEPRGETDVVDVLVIANAQLLEMRIYDVMLDQELPQVRDLIEAARRRANFLASRRYAKLARRLHTLVAEVTELAERVDNALQVTEDVYLARVYAAAMELFRVPNVSIAVDRKLAIIRDTYTALHSEAAGSRAEVLEIAVLALIAIEVVLSILRH